MSSEKLIVTEKEPNGSFDFDFFAKFFDSTLNLNKPTDKQKVILSLLRQLGPVGYRYPKTLGTHKFLGELDLCLGLEAKAVNQVVKEYADKSLLERSAMQAAGLGESDINYVRAIIKQAAELYKIRAEKKKRPKKQVGESLDSLRADREFLSHMAHSLANIGMVATGQRFVENGLIKREGVISGLINSLSSGIEDFISKYGGGDDSGVFRGRKKHTSAAQNINRKARISVEDARINTLIQNTVVSEQVQSYSKELVKYLTGQEYSLPAWVSVNVDGLVVNVYIEVRGGEYKNNALGLVKLMKDISLEDVKHACFINLILKDYAKTMLVRSHIPDN